MKTCSKCGKEKPLDGYENSKAGKFGKRADCRDCRNKARVERRKNNPESKRKDREAGRRAVAKERADNALYNAKIRGRAQRGMGLIYKRDKANGRAAKYDLDQRLSRSSLKNLFDSHGWCCYYCDVQSTDPSVITLDHVVPFARGGQNTIQNCVPACAACNSSKGNKTESEFNND